LNLNRFLKYINLLILTLFLGGSAVVYWFGWRPLPQTTGAISAPVSAVVRIGRDAQGVPHIDAASVEDTLFAQGFVTAQDRFFQMESTRRYAAGELAEIFGPAALESDLEMRRANMRQIAEKHLQELSLMDRQALAAYTRGVNFYLEINSRRLPPEFSALRFDPRPWRLSDSLLTGLSMFHSMSRSWRDEIMKSSLRVEGDAGKVDFLFSGPAADWPGPGSNAWALNGNHTGSGKPLLASDPHLGLSLPGIWYQVHLRAPGMNVAGVSLPGLPAVIIGHNERIAWGMTNLHADVQDLFLLESVEGKPGAVRINGREEAAVRRSERIAVRGAPPVEFMHVTTSLGPVVHQESGSLYALRWVAAESGGFNYPFLSLNQARNWSGFRAALERYPGPAMNFIYADVDGNIGYQAAGRIPARKDGGGDLPVPASAQDRSWHDYIPFGELPSAYNPPSGRLVSANQNPFPPDYPYKVNGNFAPRYRFQQISALLQARGGWSARDMLAVQKDVYSPYEHFLARQVRQAWENAGLKEPTLREAVETLGAWDGQMEIGRPEPLLAILLHQHLRKAFAGKATLRRGALYQYQGDSAVVETLLRRRPIEWFEDYDRLLLNALRDAIEEGKRMQGANLRRWDYGLYNRLQLGHPLFAGLLFFGAYARIGPVPMSGSSSTVKQTTPRLGPSMRMVVDLADLDNSLLNVATGQSGHVLSRHYRDQWDAHHVGRSFPMRFRKFGDVEMLELRPR